MIRHGHIAVAVALLLSRPPLAVAHEGHDEAPGAATASVGTGPASVVVSPEGRANLGLAVEEATFRAIETTLSVVAEIAALPDRSGAVTSRIAGRVTSLSVAEGDSVRKGRPLVEIESLQLGDPPPRAWYASPVGGIVIDRHVTLGESVEPNAHLLEVADLREVQAVGRLFEGQIGKVSVGEPVRVRVPTFPDQSFDGVVERLGGALDPASRSLPVYVRIRNAERKLLPRMRAELAIVTDQAEAALAIPRAALLGDFGAQFVFVESPDEPTIFSRTPVVTGLSDDRYVEIIEGLLPGDRVVTVGSYSLQFLPPFDPTSGASGDAHEGAPIAAEPKTPHRGRTMAWAAGIIVVTLIGGAMALRRRSVRGRA